MRIISLIDNVSRCECEAEHGLSLHIELDSGLKVLFDTGQSGLFARNAARLGIDLSQVDLAVISHGHYDHGGGINEFLRINSKAPIYIRESALEEHISSRLEGKVDIGLKINDINRLIFCNDIEELPCGITLFSNPPATFPEPAGNRLLLGPDGQPDDFRHEQSMIIRETRCARHSDSTEGASLIQHPESYQDSVVLFGGCAHRGIVNILEKAQTLTSGSISHVFSGMHLSRSVPDDTSTTDHRQSTGRQDISTGRHNGYLPDLAAALLAFPGIEYFTMHCTGEPAFTQLASLMSPHLHYLPCGSTLTL